MKYNFRKKKNGQVRIKSDNLPSKPAKGGVNSRRCEIDYSQKYICWLGKQGITDRDYSIQGFTGNCKGIQGFTGDCIGIRGYTRYYKGIQGITGDYKGTQGFTGDYKVIQGFIAYVAWRFLSRETAITNPKVARSLGYAGKYRGLQGFRRKYMGFHGITKE